MPYIYNDEDNSPMNDDAWDGPHNPTVYMSRTEMKAMEKLPDAPWIAEAETKGMPPYGDDEFPLSDIKDEFALAKGLIGKAVQHLIRAANRAEEYGKDKPIDELIQLLDDDIPYKMDQVLESLK